jgi:hypothetical protein
LKLTYIKFFKIVLEGHGFFLMLSDKKEAVGFFTTFFVTAECLDDARLIVADKLKAKLNENNDIGVVSNLLFASYATIDAVYLVDESESADVVGGFSFYTVNFLRRLRSYMDLVYFKVFSRKRLILIDVAKTESIDF